MARLISLPKVSALANCKLAGFSVERLMIFLTALAGSRTNIGGGCVTPDKT